MDLHKNYSFLILVLTKLFKEKLRNRFISHCIHNNNVKASKSKIIKWAEKIWNSDSLITNQMIFNSFKYSGISSSLEGIEDEI